MMNLRPVRIASATVALCTLGGLAEAQTPARSRTAAVAVYGRSAAEARQLRLQLRSVAADARLTGLIAETLERAVFDERRAEVDDDKPIVLAQRKIRQAEMEAGRFDFEAANLSIDEAGRLLDPHLGRRKARYIDRRRLEVAVRIAHARRDPQRLTAFLRAFIQRFWTTPKADTRWPPDVQEQLERIRAQTAMRPLVISSPVAAFAFVDGRSVGPTPVEVRVPVGRHHIEVVSGSGSSRSATLTVPAGDTPISTPLTPPTGLIDTLEKASSLTPRLAETVLSTAQSYGIDEVFVAGPGNQGRIKLHRLGGRSTGPVEVDDSPEALRLALIQLWTDEPRSSQLAVWPWVTTGVGVALTSVGIGWRAMARSTQADFQARTASLTQSEAVALRDQSQQEANIGAALIGVGVAVIAGGITWTLLEPEATP
ncbi:MAG: PEGA domain-containing protein [Myxococcota bacterium]